ncbi:MAG: hypothetical protein OEM01_04385 [Desulfobulbaceae bacterium]|nr:hypothetical protein [Desulfobulbaceae bacterium]
MVVETSFFEPDWSWTIFLNKGFLGVGHKKWEFYVRHVRNG